MEATYQVQGMTCAGCAASVTQAIRRISPDLDVEVRLEEGRVRVRGEHEEEAVRRAVKAAGFDFFGRVAET